MNKITVFGTKPMGNESILCRDKINPRVDLEGPLPSAPLNKKSFIQDRLKLVINNHYIKVQYQGETVWEFF